MYVKYKNCKMLCLITRVMYELNMHYAGTQCISHYYSNVTYISKQSKTMLLILLYIFLEQNGMLDVKACEAPHQFPV